MDAIFRFGNFCIGCSDFQSGLPTLQTVFLIAAISLAVLTTILAVQKNGSWRRRILCVLLGIAACGSGVLAYGAGWLQDTGESNGTATTEIHLIIQSAGQRSLDLKENLDEASLDKNVYITSGSFADMATTLERAGAIGSAQNMRLLARLNGMDRSIKAGEYAILPQLTLMETLQMLAEGRVVQRAVTIPEGLTVVEAVSIINTAVGLRGVITEIPPEGSLLPETYAYIYGDSREKLLQQMRDALDKTLAEAWTGRAADLPVKTPSEALVLASIIEKETGVKAERRQVAGVYTNRLKVGMRLQADPTVIYAMTLGKKPLGRPLTRADWAYPSPYNTYKVTGLPPTPIALAGRESILAAVQPDPHKFIYFVADGTGGHVFAETLAEHNRNVAKWRTIRRDSP